MSKMAPNWHPNGAPKLPRRCPNGPEGSKMPSRRFKDVSKMAQRGPKMAPRAHNMTPRGPKMVPKGPQVAPRWPQKEPKWMSKLNLVCVFDI